MRDRRTLAGRRADEAEAISMPDETAEEREARRERRAKQIQRKGYVYYIVFLAIFIGVPVVIILHATPFFVVEQLRCRAMDKLWADETVSRMEAGYTRYFSEPPFYLSQAYNQSVFWGTYEPSRIFAMKSRSEKPVTVGIAWYDADHAHPLRHGMPFTHNKVSAPRSTYKKNSDPEVMQIRWIVHDGLHYGKESINDAANRLRMEVEFLKGPSGSSWHVRAQGQVESKSPLHIVLYVLNGDDEKPIVVQPPDAHNDGDWSPILTGQLRNHAEEAEAFALRVFDRHSPLHDTAPWRVHGLTLPADEAFQLTASDVVGGMPEERAAADGAGIVSGAKGVELQRQRVDLRDLPQDAFRYIESEDPSTFTKPEGTIHNLIVLKKAYTNDFRLELSLSPVDAVNARAAQDPRAMDALVPRYEALSSCQLTNVFRRRENRIYTHGEKIFRAVLHKEFNVSDRLYQHLATQTLGEAFGSLAFQKGRFLQVADSTVDAAWDERGTATALWSLDLLRPSRHVATALAAVGSRTDEAFGQSFLTGLQLLFLGRWNKEMVKDVIASWLLGAQDVETGFVPARAGFSDTTRSLMPQALRYEHPTIAHPPTLLLGLQELLNEMERKEARVLRRGQTRRGSTKVRNTKEYYELEVAADRAFLERLLPALHRWRAWWHRTQCGGATEELARGCAAGGQARRPLESWPATPTGNPEDLLVYRWRSRDGHRLPASGMEDYPRPVCAGEHYMEAHVDLFAWMALLSNVISRIEVMHLGMSSPSVRVDWEAHLNALHWDEQEGRYADRVGCLTRAFSPYVGYVNLYPVMLGIVRKDTEKARATLQLAKTDLLTDHGVMSVSFASVKRAREAKLPHSNLWMGYVWPSANIMLLHAIKTTYIDLLGGAATDSGAELMALYSRLRLSQTETIREGRRWWEYYSPLDGRGEGSKTYIGTHALIMGELYDFS